MKYAGRTVRKNKFNLGDLVKVKTLKTYVGKISHMTYRFEGNVGWHYTITFPNAISRLTFAEKSLVKVPVRRKK